MATPLPQYVLKFTSNSPLSPAYMVHAVASSLILFIHRNDLLSVFVPPRAGRSIMTSNPVVASTNTNSTIVNPAPFR